MASVYHTIHVGDTLQGLAIQHYGDAGQAHRIFLANQNQMKNPNGYYPGMRIIIPNSRKAPDNGN
jgi:nucleoid-associated protein YgaU